MPKKFVDYKWVLGTMFLIKEEFKDTITNYDVNNGKDVHFIKNYKTKVRLGGLREEGTQIVMRREKIQQLLAAKGFQINSQCVVNRATTNRHAQLHQDNLHNIKHNHPNLNNSKHNKLNQHKSKHNQTNQHKPKLN